MRKLKRHQHSPSPLLLRLLPNIPAGPRDKNSLRNNCSTFPRPELTPVRGHQGLRGTLAGTGTVVQRGPGQLCDDEGSKAIIGRYPVTSLDTKRGDHGEEVTWDSPSDTLALGSISNLPLGQHRTCTVCTPFDALKMENPHQREYCGTSRVSVCGVAKQVCVINKGSEKERTSVVAP